MVLLAITQTFRFRLLNCILLLLVLLLFLLMQKMYIGAQIIISRLKGCCMRYKIQQLFFSVELPLPFIIINSFLSVMIDSLKVHIQKKKRVKRL